MNRTQLQSIKKQLKTRFDPQNVCHEHYYIQRMNPKLQIPLSLFQKDPKLKQKNLTNEEIKSIVNSIDCFQKVKFNKHSKQDVFKLNYPDSKRIVIVTGITQQFVNKLKSDFQQSFNFKVSKIKKPNQFWISIQMHNPQAAIYFKRFARNQKRVCDTADNINYKIQKKRVRIVIQDEDFFTILVDAMSEKKLIQFQQKFGKDSSILYYQRIQLNKYQSNQIANQKIQQQFFQDNFSEEQSRTTQGFDGRSLNDCIETTDQGIQAEKIEQYMNLQCPKSPRSKQQIKILYSTSHQRKQNETEKTYFNLVTQINTNNFVKEPLQLFQYKSDNHLSQSKQTTEKEEQNYFKAKSQSVKDQIVQDKQDIFQDNQKRQDQLQTKNIQNLRKFKQQPYFIPFSLSQTNAQTKQKNNLSHLKIQITQFKQNFQVKNDTKFEKQQEKNIQRKKQKHFRYQYLHMKKIFYQSQKSRKRTKHIDINIPSYLVKEDESQRYYHRFLDGIWRHGRYGSKRRDLKKDYY